MADDGFWDGRLGDMGSHYHANDRGPGRRTLPGQMKGLHAHLSSRPSAPMDPRLHARIRDARSGPFVSRPTDTSPMKISTKHRLTV